MKKNLIKLTALAAAMLLGVTAFSGCGKQKEKATLELNMDNSWRTELALNSVFHSPDFAIGSHVLCSKLKQDLSIEYLWYEMEKNERTKFFLRAQEELEPLERLTSTAYRLPNDNVAFVCRVYQNKNGKEETHRRFAEIYDSSMNYLETREIPLEEFGETEYTRGEKVFDSSGNWYILSFTYNYMNYSENGDILVEMFNSEYEKYGEIKLPRLQDNDIPRLVQCQ